MNCRTVISLALLACVLAYSSCLFAETSHETCQDASGFLREFNTFPENGPLKSIGITDLADVDEADKPTIFGILHDCLNANTTERDRYPSLEAYDHSQLEYFWSELLAAADVARKMKVLDQRYLPAMEQAEKLLHDISDAEMTAQQSSLNSVLMQTYKELKKECDILEGKSNHARLCYDRVYKLDTILRIKIADKLKDAQATQYKRDGDIAAAKRQAEYAAQQHAAALRDQQYQAEAAQQKAAAAVLVKEQEEAAIYWKIGLMLLMGATIVSVGLAFAGKVIFYNDYNDLGGSLATIALPSLLIFILGILHLPNWFNAIVLSGSFLGLFRALVMRTHKANHSNFFITLMLVAAKMTLSILYLFHFLMAFNSEKASGRRLGWMILAVMTPLLVKLVHTREGNFSFPNRRQP